MRFLHQDAEAPRRQEELLREGFDAFFFFGVQSLWNMLFHKKGFLRFFVAPRRLDVTAFNGFY